MGEGILDYSTEIIVVQLLLDVASQRIILHESGLIIPLDLRKALISLKFKKPSQDKIKTCKRITMMGDLPWTPSSSHQ